jgi:phosphoribosylaminoimidazolecarboxamide formyltransferase/IMP cyclohydrolase
VAILSSPSQYSSFINELQTTKGATSLILRRQLASAAFALSASYDSAIAAYFQSTATAVATHSPPALTEPVARVYSPALTLKYGCNPHQKPAAILSLPGAGLPFQVLNGVPGYINLLDALNAWQMVLELKQALVSTTLS